MLNTNLILRVAIDAPVYGVFDYLPPLDWLLVPLARGLRLLVPFGNSRRIGFLWEHSESTTCDPLALKAVLEFVDMEPLWSAEDLDLFSWTAHYYHYPVGEVLAMALPKRLRQGGALIKKFRNCKLNNLKSKLISTPINTSIPNLNPDQIQVVTTIIQALNNFRPLVLDGAMSYSNREIYIHLIKNVLDSDGQILILIPEIFSVIQLFEYLLHFWSDIAILHSGQTEVQRERNWKLARAGIGKIVIGTRLAVFTPIPKLALIIVEEEHNLAFKSQDSGFRYSARDVAVWRAKQRHCPIVLVSATPSLETLHNLAIKRYTHLNNFTRINRSHYLHFDLIDVRTTRLKAGLSPAMIRLLKENLAAGQQSLLFLNRRGYAPMFVCYECGWMARCANCDARLTLHGKEKILWCHHCGARQPQPQICPACQHAELKSIGQGTERLENFLTELLHGVTLLRIDSDSMSKNKELHHQLQNIESISHSILIGTQLLTKGYNLPQVTLVGIVDLDQGLYGADYRASERMAQLIMQAAGQPSQTGRRRQVVLQTRHPDHPLLQALVHKNYSAFAELALQERQQAQLPPFSAQALLCSEAKTAATAQEFLDTAMLQTPNPHIGVELMGPVPEVMEKRAGKHRFRLLLQAQTRTVLQQFLYTWVPELYKLPLSQRVRWYLDVDPQEL